MDNSSTDISKDVKIKKTNVIQVNKQSTIVKVGEDCLTKKKSSCKKKRTGVRRGGVSEKVCGRIFQKCDSEQKLYFRAVDTRPSAIVQIENKTDCVMRVWITLGDDRVISQIIEREQQVSIDVPSLKSVWIECSGDDDEGFCRGFYAICLRPVFIKRRKKKIIE